MAYVIVNYWPFLAIAAGLGFIVGWWALGSGRRGLGDDRSAGDSLS
jgi:hypothetical protein